MGSGRVGYCPPLLFNIYMDNLSVQLNNCKTECAVGGSVINHLMYVDDLVVFCPYSAGLQQLLNICSQYGFENDIKYNTMKSYILIVRTKDAKKLTFPEFTLYGSSLNVTDEVKYLGHYIWQGNAQAAV